MATQNVLVLPSPFLQPAIAAGDSGDIGNASNGTLVDGTVLARNKTYLTQQSTNPSIDSTGLNFNIVPLPLD